MTLLIQESHSVSESSLSPASTHIFIKNELNENININWVNFDGNETFYKSLMAEESYT